VAKTESTSSDPVVRKLTLFFGSLDKAIRGNRLYRGEGEIVARQLADLVEKAEAALEHGSLTIRLAPFGLVYEGDAVTPTDQRFAYLFRLFCDGVRELTISPGLDEAQLTAIIEVFGTDPAGGDDLVTMLWRRELTNFRYYAVDSFAAGAAGDGGGQAALAERETVQLDRGGLGDVELALTAGDLRALRVDDLLDWVREARCPTTPHEDQRAAAEAVAKGYQAPSDPARFIAIAIRASADADGPNAMVCDVFDAMLNTGNVDGVLAILEGVAAGGARVPPQVVRLREQIGASLPRLAGMFCADLDRFSPTLAKMVPFAQDTLVALLTELPTGEAEARLQDLLGEAGVDLTPFYSKRLGGSEDEVIAAVRALGRIGSEQSMAMLGEALSSTLTTVRRAALDALGGRYNPEQRVALARVLKDPDPENRRLALQIIAGSGDRKMCWSLLALAQDPTFDLLESAEQKLIFETLGAFRDNRTLEHFDKILAARGMGRNRMLIDRQKLAVAALAATGTDEAKQTLEKHKGRWLLSSEVKQAIASALSRWGADTPAQSTEQGA